MSPLGESKKFGALHVKFNKQVESSDTMAFDK